MSTHESAHLKPGDDIPAEASAPQRSDRTVILRKVQYIDVPLSAPSEVGNPNKTPAHLWESANIGAVANATVTAEPWNLPLEQLETARAILVAQETIRVHAIARTRAAIEAGLQAAGWSGTQEARNCLIESRLKARLQLADWKLLIRTTQGRSLMLVTVTDTVDGVQYNVPYASFRLGENGSKQLAGGIIGKLMEVNPTIRAWIKWVGAEGFELVTVKDIVITPES